VLAQPSGSAAPPLSSTTVKSALSGRSTICTRTVASAGLSVKLTRACGCHGAVAMRSAVSPAMMQAAAVE